MEVCIWDDMQTDRNGLYVKDKFLIYNFLHMTESQYIKKYSLFIKFSEKM